MTATRSQSHPIDLRKLLVALAQEIVLKGKVFKDPQYSLYYVAREAVGWQNWMGERQLPMTGSPWEVVQQAAQALKLNPEDAEQALSRANRENCVPSAKFMDRGADVSCWMRVATLNRSLFKSQCPMDVQLEALERMTQPRAPHPEGVVQQDSLGRQQQSSPAAPVFSHRQTFSGVRKPAQTNLQSPGEPPVNVPPIALETEGTIASQHHLNTQLAQMGRQLVAEVGMEHNGQPAGNPKRTLAAKMGRAQYKLVLNLADNILRIYAQERGTVPILVDANGNIDHANACVLASDAAAFRSALTYLQRQRQSNIGVER